MNRSGGNNSGQKGDYSVLQKGFSRVTTLILFSIGLALLAGVVFILIGSNNNRPSTTSTSEQLEMDRQQTQKDGSPGSIATSATGTVITAGDSEFGTMLFDGKGQAIYIWELEKSSKAECYGSCAEAWPPVLTNGKPQAANGVNNDLLGTTERTDGSTQVTYNGHPLYYYAHEEAGEVKCHNVSTHGGFWWVIQPSGDRAD